MTSFLNLLLTTDKKQRLRIRRSLLAGLIFLICIGFMIFLASMNYINPNRALYLSLGMMSTCFGFYVALRSGFNLRFKEPALTLAQTLVAMTWICLAYANMGAAHTGTLMLYALVMVFGIFVLDIRSTTISANYGVLAMSGTIIYKIVTDPQIYPWTVEVTNLLLVVTIIPTIAQLSKQLTNMRLRLKLQKEDLETAISHIERIAAYDELTGLINRRRMTEVLGSIAVITLDKQRGLPLL